MDRSDVALLLKNEAMRVTPELQSEYYTKKKYQPFYPKFTTVKPISSMEWTAPKMGGGSAYSQETSLIGIPRLFKRAEKEAIKFVDASLGFPIYIKKQSYDVGAELTLELNRDVKSLKTQLKNWLIDQNLPDAVMQTKEEEAAKLITEGAYVAGSDMYDNSIAGILNPSYGKFVYDGKPLFNLSNNLRSNKAGSTFYNHLGATTYLTYDNLVSADTLLMSTNAKKEDNTPFNNNLQNFLMTGTALRLTSEVILNSTLTPNNNNNSVNPLKGAYEPIANPFLNTTTGWVAGNKYGIVWYDSDDIQFEVWKVYESNLLRISAHVDLAYGVKDWRALVAGGLATA